MKHILNETKKRAAKTVPFLGGMALFIPPTIILYSVYKVSTSECFANIMKYYVFGER